MDVIGLAGRSGSGKSAAARELSKREGVAWIDLDRVAWETYWPRTPTYWRLVSRFGRGILAADGAVDRPRLAELAFSDEKGRKDLDAIVHPAVVERLREIIREKEARGTRLLLVEGALLASSPHVDRALFRAILWLEASDETRRLRLERAGRRRHEERTLEEPEPEEVLRIDADGSIPKTVQRIVETIERL